MESKDWTTIVFMLLTLLLGIARSKKKREQEKLHKRSVPQQMPDYSTPTTPDASAVVFKPSVSTFPNEEASRATPDVAPMVSHLQEEPKKENLIKKEFDLKKAVLYSEILKPKFDEFV